MGQPCLPRPEDDLPQVPNLMENRALMTVVQLSRFCRCYGVSLYMNALNRPGKSLGICGGRTRDRSFSAP